MNVHQLYINGKYVDSKSDEMIDVVNPSTEQVISKIANATEEETNQAIETAFEAQKKWAKQTQVERGKIVRDLGQRLEANKERFVELLIEEQGKDYELANGEVQTAIDYFYYMSEWARRIEGEIVPSDRPNEQILMQRKPIGVVGGIVPWNFPVFILARKVATSLITGCSIVLKPSQQTPNTAVEFTKLVDQSDLPAGVYNLVTGKGSSVGNILASHPKVAMITMTGGVGAGTKVMEAAAQNMTKVNLELGGKAPAIVTKHADIDLAVENITASRLTNNGQACTNAERVYVHEDVSDEFIDKLTKAFKETTYGNPLQNKQADIGPLINKEHLEGVHEMVQRAIEEGARVVTGGQQAKTEKGFFYEPTILVNVEQKSEIIQEEIFGPVLPIMTFKEFDQAIEWANDSKYGLSSSVYTENYHEAMRAADELLFGETFVNRENFEAIQGYHAGLRQSGLGGTDGKHGVGDFLVTHAVYMQFKQE
ncbi:aldehyde dehydrogenase [Alkalicoccobacillus murimartini]|uniref:Lactaldehyde dehydrogenase/glycolaldehyde dehydrogenase n=1 Tax=Alkalicoccobacillus murimartini TaxID=171685 RepID=A0ABT9YH18_9BACI|nr:aldehyde dehydrogenase [Alkalicoccobacillus murimartini]MDQ0207137.1 lactaldehyde dehydrogenase/glycolaldehyde dehydrogenase [Alkalicoccobacillus murimartini]